MTISRPTKIRQPRVSDIGFFARYKFVTYLVINRDKWEMKFKTIRWRPENNAELENAWPEKWRIIYYLRMDSMWECIRNAGVMWVKHVPNMSTVETCTGLIYHDSNCLLRRQRRPGTPGQWLSLVPLTYNNYGAAASFLRDCDTTTTGSGENDAIKCACCENSTVIFDCAWLRSADMFVLHFIFWTRNWSRISLIVLLVGGNCMDALQKSLRLHRFISDLDEIWHGYSSSKYASIRSRIFNMT